MLKPFFTLTWYPGAYPAVASPVVIQSADHHCDESPALAAMVSQSVQEAEYLRGATPSYFLRGQRRTRLDWVEVRSIASPSAALATALEVVAAMPSSTGWLRIELTDEGRAWALSPCAIRSVGYEHDPRRSLLRLRWELLCGPLDEIAVETEEFAWLWEDGTEILWEDGSYLALENAP